VEPSARAQVSVCHRDARATIDARGHLLCSKLEAMPRHRVLLLLCLLVACGGDDGPSWHMLSTEQPAALLSVWGTTTRDVWVVGGRSELAGAPTVLHFDGASWSRLDSGQHGVDLWWVFGFDRGDVFFTGSGGTILRYRNAAFERMTTPRSGTIFGLWGATPDDLWAVGAGDDGNGIVWHYDGSQWQDVAMAPVLPNRVFKVHGQRADDVWISCAGGVSLHWDGAALTSMPTGISSSLFSIVTTPDVVISAGGVPGQEGRIVEHDAAGWTTQALVSPVAWRGVAAGADQVYAVGESGVVAQRTATGWSLTEGLVTEFTFHAAWVDPTGGLWGVGGMFDTLPLTLDGFLTYYGVATPSEVSP
jgi:hypothetical protein